MVESDITAETVFPDVCLGQDRPDYVVTGLLDVSADLTIEPGVIIVFEESTGLRVENGGAITAAGTDVGPIVMTGRRRRRGVWKGILFRADDVTSEMDWVEIRFAGSEAFAGFDAAALSVDNDARLMLTRSTVVENESYALILNPRAELVDFVNYNLSTAFDDVFDFSAYVPDKQMGAFDGESAYGRRVQVYPTASSLNAEITIPNLRGAELGVVDFQMAGRFEVHAPITIDPGVALAFEEAGGKRVNDGGTLYALGTEDEAIYFRGSTLDGGFWRGIFFRADDLTSEMDHVLIRDGGREAWPGVSDPADITVFPVATLTVSNFSIQHSAGWRVWLGSEDATFVQDNNEYFANASGDVGVFASALR